MSLLSAGKQISAGGNKAYGRGLFIADPDEVQRRARKQQQYQQQLRMQMEQDKRRKAEQKKKEQEQDMKLEARIKEDMKKQIDKKPERSPPKNDKNVPPPPAKSQVFKPEPPRPQYRQKIVDQPYNFKFNTHMATEGSPVNENTNPYLPRNYTLIQAQEQQYFQEHSAQKLRGMHQALDEKMSEVYKKIKNSQDLEIDREFQMIRKKIMSSNNSYGTQNLKSQELQGQISHFYRIPKKAQHYGVKNLDYQATSQMKRTDNLLKPVTQQKLDYSRQVASRESRQTSTNRLTVGKDDRLWGVKKGKNNYLGNRQAMDYQINNIMGKIDNMLEEENEQ